MLDESTLLSINRFSGMTGVARSTLRYYDRLGLFSPASRGRNNYRYYLPHQITTLNFINALTELGVPLAKILKLTKDRTPEHVLGILVERERALDQELKKLQATYTLIHAFQENIVYGELASEEDIQITRKAESPIVMGPKNNWENEKSYFEAFAEFFREMSRGEYHFHYPVGAYYETIEKFASFPSKPCRFFSADPNGNDRKVGGKYVVGYARGGFGDAGNAAGRLEKFASENGLLLKGPVYVMYLLDEMSLMDESRYLAQISGIVVNA